MRSLDRRIVTLERKLRGTHTDVERKLWYALRDRRLSGFKFVRQEAIGLFIVDFVCREWRLVIEVDGGQHVESAKDAARDARLTADGYRVMRFWNNDVLKNRKGVLEVILQALNADWIAAHPARRFASRHPLPVSRERGKRRMYPALVVCSDQLRRARRYRLSKIRPKAQYRYFDS